MKLAVPRLAFFSTLAIKKLAIPKNISRVFFFQKSRTY